MESAKGFLDNLVDDSVALELMYAPGRQSRDGRANAWNSSACLGARRTSLVAVFSALRIWSVPVLTQIGVAGSSPALHSVFPTPDAALEVLDKRDGFCA
jgi:hypothetical protein